VKVIDLSISICNSATVNVETTVQSTRERAARSH